MARCEGKGYPGCNTCINRELDPFQCEECEDESNWEGDEDADEDDTFEELSVTELSDLIHGGYE